MLIFVTLKDLWRVGAVASTPIFLTNELVFVDERFQLSVGSLLSKTLLWFAGSLQMSYLRENCGSGMTLSIKFILLHWSKIHVRISSWRFRDPQVLEFHLQTWTVNLGHINIIVLWWAVTNNWLLFYILMLCVILLFHLDSFLCWRIIVFNNLFSSNNEGIYNSVFDHTKSGNSLTYTVDEAKIRFFLASVINFLSIRLGNLGLNLSLFTWWFALHGTV